LNTKEFIQALAERLRASRKEATREIIEQNQYQYQPHPISEPPIRKRRIHWIVPVAISVIIILSFMFYFRNFHTSRQLSVVSQQPEIDNRQSTIDNQRPVPSSPKAEEGTASGMRVAEGTRFFKLAREFYGNPYLWVLIYKENLDKIPDPDMLISGRELLIPVLEGTPERLTRNDSLAVSEGYRLVYEFYKAQDDTRAKDFSRAMKRYKPKA
jgi:hypothetical protein